MDAPNGGTAWKLCIDCEGSSCKNHIKRKAVNYEFRETYNWKCSNYKIDGISVFRTGSKQLSIGRHVFSAECACHDSSYAKIGITKCSKERGYSSLIVGGTKCNSRYDNFHYQNCMLGGFSNNRVLDIK